MRHERCRSARVDSPARRSQGRGQVERCRLGGPNLGRDGQGGHHPAVRLRFCFFKNRERVLCWAYPYDIAPYAHAKLSEAHKEVLGIFVELCCSSVAVAAWQVLSCRYMLLHLHKVRGTGTLFSSPTKAWPGPCLGGAIFARNYISIPNYMYS